MDVDQQAFVNVLIQRVKDYYHKMNVYRLVLAHLKASGRVPDVDEIIEAFLQDQTLQDASSHDLAFLDKRIPTVSQADLDSALQKWLENLPLPPVSN